MAWNPFIGWQIEDLEAALRTAQEDLAAGKTVSSASSGDVSKSERIDSTPRERIKLIYAALSKLDSEKYPAADITPTTEFKVVFS